MHFWFFSGILLRHVCYFPAWESNQRTVRGGEGDSPASDTSTLLRSSTACGAREVRVGDKTKICSPHAVRSAVARWQPYFADDSGGECSQNACNKILLNNISSPLCYLEVGGSWWSFRGSCWNSPNARKASNYKAFSPKALINQRFSGRFEPPIFWRSFSENEEKMERKTLFEEKMKRKKEGKK